MILEAERLGCLRDVLVIAAALSIQDPRERPEEQRPQADQLHARFKHESQRLPHLAQPVAPHQGAAARAVVAAPSAGCASASSSTTCGSASGRTSSPSCARSARRWGSSVGQPGRHRPRTRTASTRRCCPGCSATSGARGARQGAGRRSGGPMREYLGARNARFAIFPGSVLKGSNPQFLMAGELVETSRLWARQNAAIKPEWAEKLGAHLVKRTYSEPHWSRKRAAVMARERVTLYGVPLVADRLVPYGKVDAAAGARAVHPARAGLRRVGLAATGSSQRTARLLEEAEELEHRARRRDIVVDEQTLFDFYDARVGADVVSGAHFDQWWKRARQERPDLLTFDPAMLTHDTADEVRASDFPSEWHDSDEAGLTFPISYHFEPGAADDGLTIDVPVATLNRVEADDFSWNVPGLREELVTEPDPRRCRRTCGSRSCPHPTPRASSSPRCRRARSRCSTPSSGARARPPASSCRARPGTGPRSPEHLRPTYRVVDEGGAEQAAARTSTRSRSRCGRSSSRRWPTSPPTPGWPPPARRRGRSARSRSPSMQRRAGPRGARSSRRWSTRARPSGCGSSARPTRPRPATGSAYAAWCCSRSARRRVDDVLAAARPTPSKLGPRRVAVRLGRRPARRRARRGGAARSSTRARRCATRRRTTPWWPRRAGPAPGGPGPAVHDVMRVLEAWRSADKALSGRAEMTAARARPTCGRRSAGWCTRGSSARPGPTRLRALPALPRRGHAPPRASRRRAAPRSTATGS